MHYSIDVDIAAPPSLVWRVLSDGVRWPEWTPTVTSVELLDLPPLRLGLRARIRQPKLPPTVWTVTELVEGQRFVWTSKSPGATVIADHSVTAVGSGSRVTLSVRFEGWWGKLIGRLTRNLNNRYLALEAAGLKKRCEEQARDL